MSGYNQTFNLTLTEVDLIERSLRQQISGLARSETIPHDLDTLSNHKQIVTLMHVLGTLHNQKIWYGQVHKTHVPLG